MISKTIIAIIVILFIVNARDVTVGDDEPFQRTSFNSIFKLKDIKAGQNITVNIQWGTNTLLAPIEIYLYSTKAVDGDFGTRLFCNNILINTCRVTFNESYTEETGDYWLLLGYTGGTITVDTDILVSTLTVTGDFSQRSNPTLLKQTTALGPFRFHRIYSSTPKTLRIIATASAQDQFNYFQNAEFVRVYLEKTEGQGYQLQQKINPNEPISNNQELLTLTRQFNLQATGYYWIVIGRGTQIYNYLQTYLQSWRYRLSYSTQIYQCPYIPDYPDYSGIFKGCQFAPDNSKFPCIQYNQFTRTCLNCYKGYKIANGRCVEAECPDKQYKKYGQCIQNPTGCDVYNDFVKCNQCSIGYTLSNGICNRTPLTCTGRTFFNNITWTCDQVNEKCKEWGTDGLCISCLSATQKSVNGICVPIDSTCTSTQFVDAQGNCVQNDLLCDNFEKYGGKCLKCIWGYQLDAAKNKCNKVICPERYVPNDFGKCVKVSDLCVDYDVRGNCLGCIPTHTIINGVCLQLESPSPCPPRQYLGNDNFCHDVSDFCQIYEKTTGVCSQCIGGYYLMYTGECVIQKNCKSRQVLINNDCHDVSPTCGNYDRATGKCLNCISQDFELYYGLCIPIKTCGPRQWTDINGGCHDVDAKCNTFNPSSGACTSCVQGYNYLNGICCGRGQFNIDGNCVSATSASSLSNSNGCRNYTNGIGCLRCDNGFQRIQDQYGLYYCQAL